jgi:hypothetical protein
MWEHLVMPPDHWDDDSMPEGLELSFIHPQAGAHLAKGLVAFLLRYQRQIPTQLGKHERRVHPIRAAVSLVEKRLCIG